MVQISIRIVTSGNHAYLADNGITNYTTCLKTKNQTGINVIENRGSSNHGSGHDTTYNKTITLGDILTVSLWEYIFANNKSVTVYVNGILFGTNSGTSQCVTVTGTVGTAYFKTNTPTEPIYLERLSQLQKKSRPITRRSDIFNQYI